MASLDQFCEGDVLVNKYRLERLIGTGGMGIVYAATQLELDRKVAIKLLRPESYKSESLIARILIEARATARLSNPHVAKLLDVGRLESNVPFLVMEYLEGTSLSDVLSADGPRSVGHAVKYVLETCEALAEAHRAGIVHRDLKPANLFLTRNAYGEPCIKVLDFGISKFLGAGHDGSLGLTDSRSLIGSPAYMSPEQMRSAKNVDRRTDIWSLGAVLFELLSGRPAWTGQSLSELCVQVTHDPSPTLHELCPGVVPELSAIVARCLQKEPSERYQDVADLALALKPFTLPGDQLTLARVLQLSGRTQRDVLQTTQQPDIGRDAPSIARTLEGSAVTASSPSGRRRILPFALVALVLLVGALFGAWPRFAHRSTTAPAATATFASSLPVSNALPVPTIQKKAMDDVGAQPSITPSAATQPAAPLARTPVAGGRRRVSSAASTKPTSPTSSATANVDPMSIRE